MSAQLAGIWFCDNLSRFRESDDLIVHIPSAVATRDHLFDILSQELSLPSYFGGNWDALSECLRDLSWMEGICVESPLMVWPRNVWRVEVALLGQVALKLHGQAGSVLSHAASFVPEGRLIMAQRFIAGSGGHTRISESRRDD